jgi:hypothetical protein
MLFFIQFVKAGWADHVDESLLTRPELPIVGPCFGETQAAVWATQNHIRILVVLAVIFPVADRADIVMGTTIECKTTAARALESTAHCKPSIA